MVDNSKRCSKNPRIRFNLEKLKDPDVAEIREVRGKCAALNLLDSNVDTLASSINDMLYTKAKEVLGRQCKKIQ